MNWSMFHIFNALEAKVTSNFSWCIDSHDHVESLSCKCMLIQSGFYSFSPWSTWYLYSTSHRCFIVIASVTDSCCPERTIILMIGVIALCLNSYLSWGPFQRSSRLMLIRDQPISGLSTIVLGFGIQLHLCESKITRRCRESFRVTLGWLVGRNSHAMACSIQSIDDGIINEIAKVNLGWCHPRNKLLDRYAPGWSGCMSIGSSSV